MTNTAIIEKVCEILKQNATAVDTSASWPEQSIRSGCALCWNAYKERIDLHPAKSA
jgi:hypothetical protein